MPFMIATARTTPMTRHTTATVIRRATVGPPRARIMLPEPACATLAGAGGAPLAAFKAAETDAERLLFIETLGNPGFDPIALAETVLRVPLWDLVAWLQRWTYDLLLARIAGRVRYSPNHERAISDAARHCHAADIAAYLRRLAQARALARHPLNARLFIEDLLLQYQRLVARP